MIGQVQGKEADYAGGRGALTDGQLRAFCGALDLLTFAVLLGGLVAIGGIVAPVAFGVMRHAAELAALPGTQTRLAGAVVGGSLRIYNYAALVCAAWLTARIWILTARRTAAARFVAVVPCAICFLIAVLNMATLFPLMDSAQAAGAMRRFDQLHHTYERFAFAQMALLILFSFGYAAQARAGQTQ